MYNLKLKNNNIYLNINNDDGKKLQSIIDQILTLSKLLNYQIKIVKKEYKNACNEYHICIENDITYFDIYIITYFDIYIDVSKNYQEYHIYTKNKAEEELTIKEFINKLNELLLHIK